MPPPDDRESGGGEDKLVGIAGARDRYEAAMIKGLLSSVGIPCFTQRAGIDGPLIGSGVLNPRGGGLRVLVPASRVEEAQAVLADVSAEDASDVPEPVNARYLEDARGHRPREYGLLGAYARIYLWSFGILVLAFAVFLLLRSL